MGDGTKAAIGILAVGAALVIGMYVLLLAFQQDIFLFLPLFLAAGAFASFLPPRRMLAGGLTHLALVGVAVLVGYVFYEPIWGGLGDTGKLVALLVISAVAIAVQMTTGFRDMRAEVRKVVPARTETEMNTGARPLPLLRPCSTGVALLAGAIWAAVSDGNYILGSLLLTAALLPMLFGPEQRGPARITFIAAVAAAIFIGYFGHGQIWAPMDRMARLEAALFLPFAAALALMLRWTWWFMHKSQARQNEAEGLTTWAK